MSTPNRRRYRYLVQVDRRASSRATLSVTSLGKNHTKLEWSDAFKLVRTKFKIASLIAVAFIASGCGGGGQSIMPERQITPTVGPEVRIPAPPVSNIVAFMGDSITARWDLNLYDAGPTVNLGTGGDTTAAMLKRFDIVISSGAGVVAILGGVNDIAGYEAGATTAIPDVKSIASMAAKASAAGIRVILCSVMPATFASSASPQVVASIRSETEVFNQTLIDLAQSKGYLYADYYDGFLNPDGSVNTTLLADGLHPNADGYAVMWKVIAPLINEELGQ